MEHTLHSACYTHACRHDLACALSVMRCAAFVQVTLATAAREAAEAQAERKGEPVGEQRREGHDA
jgi:hypothetical protein